MHEKSKRRRWTGITGGLLVAAVACLACGEAEAQSWQGRRYQAARNTQAEAQLAAYVTQLNQLVAQERAARAAAAARQRVYRPGEIPVNIPVNTPMYGPLTPGQRNVADMLNGWAIGSARAACEARRASQPYSIYRPGRLNDGWYDTMTGPRPRSCY